MGLDTDALDRGNSLANISFTYIPDPSIFPGDLARNAPLLGSLPGLPDLPSANHTIEVTRTVTVPATVRQPATYSALARNPTAVNMKLTGEEARLDMIAAQLALDKVKEQAITIDRVVATGIPSDIYNNAVGVVDPAQIPLGMLRAEAMAKSFTLLAGQKNIPTPKPEKAVEEDVFTAGELHELSKIEDAMRISEQKLLTRYQKHQLPRDTTEQIDGYSQPGAKIEVFGHKTITTHTQKTVSTVANQLGLNIPGEFLALMGGIAGAALGYVGAFRRYITNASALAQRKAVRKIRRQLRAILRYRLAPNQ